MANCVVRLSQYERLDKLICVVGSVAGCRLTSLLHAMMGPMPVKSTTRASSTPPAFDLREFLDTPGLRRRITKHARSSVIFAQGSPADEVYYVQQGSVKISVLSRTGKEAVVAIVGAKDFFGEGCLAGQTRRMSTASALSASTLLVVEKAEMQD